MIKTKNKAVLDPRQLAFINNYFDPKSETFGNCTSSGKKAGFTQEYSENILQLMPDWLAKIIEDAELVATAMKNLNDQLNDKDEKAKSLKWDATKFVLERLNKNKFSTRSELTGRNGKDLLPTPIIEVIDVQTNNSNQEDTQTNQEN